MSLRIRLTAISVLLVALGLTAAAVATHRYIESFMIDRLDQQLAVATPFNPGGLESLPGGSYAAVIGPRGRVLGTSHGTTDSELATLERAPDGYSSSGNYRILSRDFPAGRGNPPGGRGTLVVAAPLRDVNATVSELTRDEVIIGMLVLALVGGIAYWSVGVGMRPLARIEDTAGQIAAGDLSQRVAETDPGTEVGRLGIALNAMLSQIEQAFAERQASENRLRRFVADAVTRAAHPADLGTRLR